MNPNDPAFPQPPYWMQSEKRWRNCADSGITVRLYIATHALQGLLARSEPLADTEQLLFAKAALGLADALIEQEKKH